MLRELANALRNKPLGQGMAQQAADTLKTAPSYRAYVVDAQTQGKTPVSLEEFMKGAR